MFKRLLSFFAISLVVGVTACVDDNTPPTEVTLDADFVGYSNAATRQTVCGNCHISKQRDWADTRHSTAWASVADRPNASTACASCHTTNGSSNDATDSWGFPRVSADAKPHYYDVQCESCHGPGSGHVQAPDDAQPLTTIAADTGMTTGCGTCHSGDHNPFIAEWRSSRHGRIDSYVNGRTTGGCDACHDGRSFIRRFDPDAKFTESTAATWQPQTCATCHDPHGSDNPADLRMPIATADVENNLCMECHHKRSVPDPTNSRGPHSPQGPMLLGEAGWRPSTFTYDSTMAVSSHGSSANPRLCAGCHVNRFSSTDALTGQTVYTTGHRFTALPCLTPGGAPDTTATCDLPARSFQACATGGCHSTQNAARAAFNAVELRFENYVRTIWVDVDGDGVVDAFPADSGMLAVVKLNTPAEFTVNPTITVAEGALFNARLMQMPGNGVHNPFYGEALMVASINELRSRYGLPVPPAMAQQLVARAAALRMTNIR